MKVCIIIADFFACAGIMEKYHKFKSLALPMTNYIIYYHIDLEIVHSFFLIFFIDVEKFFRRITGRNHAFFKLIQRLAAFHKNVAHILQKFNLSKFDSMKLAETFAVVFSWWLKILMGIFFKYWTFDLVNAKYYKINRNGNLGAVFSTVEFLHILVNIDYKKCIWKYIRR